MRRWLHWAAGIAGAVGLAVLGWTNQQVGIVLLICATAAWIGTENHVAEYLVGNPLTITAAPVAEIILALAGIGFVVWARMISPAHESAAPLSVSDRPYIFAEGACLVDNDERIRVTFLNSGKSPGLQVGDSVRYLIPKDRFDLDGVSTDWLAKPEGYGTVAPNQRFIQDVASGKMSPGFLLMKEGKTHGYVLGYLTYIDLGGTKHQPRFCFAWSPNDNAFVQCPNNSWVKGQTP
jgi:hypothetical protein